MMKAWEFLLQREGDRTWLPLETPTVEILEGRYRVVARTPRQDEAVDIYVSYVSTQDDPPKRRVQQRSRQTNAEGLVAFLPFTTLGVGRWELRCRPHVEPGSLEYQWPAVLQLQVLEQESAEVDDLFGWDLPGDRSEAEPPEQPLGLSVPADAAGLSQNLADPGTTTETGPRENPQQPEDIQQLAQRMSQMVVNSVLSVAEGLPASPETPPLHSPATPQPSEPDAPPTLVPDLVPDLVPALVPVTVTLDAETLTLPDDRKLTLTGEIEAIAPQAPLPPLVLTVELRDPNTTEIWVTQQQAFGATPAASRRFDLDLGVPTSCNSQLLLGTATVWQRQSDSELQALTSARFTALAPVDALLSNVAATDATDATDATADPGSETESGTIDVLQQKAARNFVVSKLGQSPTAARANRNLNAELLELLKPAAERASTDQSSGKPPVFKPARSRILPPKLTPRPAQTPAPNSPDLDLPSFGEPNPVFTWTPPESDEYPPSNEHQPSDLSAQDLAAAWGGAAIETPEAGSVARPMESETGNQEETQEGNQEGNQASYPLDQGDAIASSTNPVVGSTQSNNPYAIPEGASLEELAELFGPAPEIAQPSQAAPQAPPETTADAGDTVSSESPAVAQRIVLPAALAGAVFALASEPTPENHPNSSNYPNDPSDPNDPETSVAGSPKALGDAATTIAPSANPSANPSDLDNGEEVDPFLNRLHELTIPQPSTESPSPTLLAEVVVDDEDLPPTRLAWMQQSRPSLPPEAALAIDAPELEVPDKDLVVGETLRVSLRIPAQPTRLCARIWLLDCQSRTLLSEPQWVTVFLPLSDEQVEAAIELKIPEGSVELQVEAIAVDPDSQRESRKVAVRRSVILPENVESASEENRFNPWMT